MLSYCQKIKAKKLIASIPLRLWFAKAYRNNKDPRDCHYHEFEDWQFDWLLEKSSWKIIETQKWTSPINKIGFLNSVKTKGILLEKLLNNLHSNCDVIKDIRIKGLMAGIEFKNNKTALEVYKDTSKKDLVTTLVKGNIIRITPPLIIKPEELKKGIKIISNCLSKIKS